MKISKITAALILCVCFALSGCSSSGQDDVQTYAWPLATSSTEDSITHIFAKAFADEVSILSNGKMKVQVYSQSTLGVDREVLESLKDGDIPFAAQSPATQVVFMPQLCIYDAPVVFDDIESARNTIDQEEFLESIHPIYLESGYRLLGMADQGFRVMSTNTIVTDFNSFRGQKIRTMENPFHLQFWRSLNASPTPMTFSEVYIALQQSIIDSQENSYIIIESAKLFEQQNYLIETNHIPDFITLLVSNKFYEELSAEQQNVIDEAAHNAQINARIASDSLKNEKKQILLDHGMEIIVPDAETKRKMREVSAPVLESIKGQVGEELFEIYTGASS